MSESRPASGASHADKGEVVTGHQWAAVHAALSAGDMPAVVALLHPLAVTDPHGVELFMAVVETLGRSA